MKPKQNNSCRITYICLNVLLSNSFYDPSFFNSLTFLCFIFESKWLYKNICKSVCVTQEIITIFSNFHLCRTQKNSFYHDIVMMIFCTRFEIDGVIKLVKSQELAVVFSIKIFFHSKVERTTA